MFHKIPVMNHVKFIQTFLHTIENAIQPKKNSWFCVSAFSFFFSWHCSNDWFKAYLQTSIYNMCLRFITLKQNWKNLQKWKKAKYNSLFMTTQKKKFHQPNRKNFANFRRKFWKFIRIIISTSFKFEIFFPRIQKHQNNRVLPIFLTIANRNK